MKYGQRLITGNGTEIRIRNAAAADGAAVLENFNQTHAETDYLLTYPNENRFDVEQEDRVCGMRPKPQGLPLADGGISGSHLHASGAVTRLEPGPFLAVRARCGAAGIFRLVCCRTIGRYAVEIQEKKSRAKRVLT